MQTPLSTRRVFLQKGLTLLAVAPTVPAFLDRTVMALADPFDVKRTQAGHGKDEKILVVVQLSGGNDGLSTIIPYGDDAYYRARPTIAQDKKAVLKVDDYLALNPNLAPLKGLYDDGRMAIIQGVGYPNPNRSHFKSMDIWHSADPEKEVVTTGWVGRYFDNACPGSDPHVGVSIGETLPLSMQGQRIMPLSFERPETYRYNGQDKQRYLKLNTREQAEESRKAKSDGSKNSAASSIIRPSSSPQSELDFLHRTAMDAQLSSDDILRMTRTHQSPSAYPNGEFGAGLKTIAAMIAGGLPTRVYYVSLGGFDTHAGQINRHDQLMKQLAQGISAFWEDLAQQKNEDRVLMMTFSEFGRRVEQNASGGTDHGAAAPMLLLGPGIKQGIVGRHPSLTDLDHGDLKFGIDFRGVYATVLQGWLQTPSKPILGRQFETLGVI